jgi:hypothetical protein
MKSIVGVLFIAVLSFCLVGCVTTKTSEHQLLSEVTFKDVKSCAYKWVDNKHVEIEIRYEGFLLDLMDIIVSLDLGKGDGSIMVTAYAGEIGASTPTVKKLYVKNGPNRYTILINCSALDLFKNPNDQKVSPKWYYKDKAGLHDLKESI